MAIARQWGVDAPIGNLEKRSIDAATHILPISCGRILADDDNAARSTARPGMRRRYGAQARGNMPSKRFHAATSIRRQWLPSIVAPRHAIYIYFAHKRRW